MDIKLTDFLIICATILGPILAVQAQKWLERGQEIKNNQKKVFKTLMATRALNLSPLHVEALNAVPVEFCNLRNINSKWKVYFEHLLKDAQATPNWEEERKKILYELLLLMSKHLKYDFDEVEIKKVYSPVGHLNLETDQEIIRSGFVSLFKGKTVIPIEIRSQINSQVEDK